MKWLFRCSISVLLVLVAATGSVAFGQYSSGIEGIAHDTSGAVIPGAKVNVTDTRLGVTKSVLTNQEGFFRVDSIAASTYTVEIQAQGFETWRQAGLDVQPGQIRTIAPQLQIGEVSTEITVSASEQTVDLVSPSTSAVVGSETVSQVPLPGQNVYALGAIAPGVTGSGVTSGDNYTNEYSININAAGLRQEQNGYMIDDAFSNTPSRGGSTSISPNPEIVESIKIEANSFDAQKGRNGGALIDVYTKSGTNQLHGTFDYYFLNNTLTSRLETQSKLPNSQRNEYSATMGGPAIKNKLFWFGAIDVMRSNVTNSWSSTYETKDFVNWAKTALPNTLGTQILQIAPPQSYPTGSFKTVSEVASQSYYPLPAGIDPNMPATGTTNITFVAPKNGYQWNVRGDYYVSNSDRLYVDVMRTYYDGVGFNGRPAVNIGQANSSDFININYSHAFSAKLANTMSASLIRPQGALLPNANEKIPYIWGVGSVAGFANWGAGNFIQSTYGWRDFMTATMKTHTLKFGADVFNIREVDNQSSAFDRPSYTFDSLLDFVQDKATSESGTPVSLTTHKEAPYQRRYRALVHGYYLQDDWKVSPRLTVNAGLRMDVMQNYFAIYTPSATNFLLGSGNSVNEQITNGKATLLGTSHVLDHNLYGVSPRLGFAWDMFGNGRTSLRAGAGLFSDQPPYLRITDLISTNLPNYYTPNINVRSGDPTPTFQLCSAPVGYNQDCPIVDTSNVTVNSHGGIDGVRASVNGFSPHFSMGQIEAWTLSLQHQVQNNLIVELNYSGTAAHHLPVENDNGINRFDGDMIVNKGTLKRLSPYFANIAYAYTGGNSVGHYGSGMVTRRFSHGFSMRGIYTYGKALDYTSNTDTLDAGSITTGTGVIESQNLKAQRGRADFSIKQQFTADGTWITPTSYGNSVARQVLGNWVFSGVWVMQSGLPFTVYNSAPFKPVFDGSGNVVGNTGGDYNADGTQYDLPSVPSFGRHLSGMKKKNFINGIFGDPATAAAKFPAPALGVEGNLGRNTYDQPGYNNLNFTFGKNFETPFFFSERLKLEAKGEVTNLFNRVNLVGVHSDMNGGQFGQYSNQLPARMLQLHLRASF